MADDVRETSADPWEAAYLRFETPDEEIRKFTARLRQLGAASWPKDAHVVELFCGRGGGLEALERLGFRNLYGADLSPRLLSAYAGPAACACCDCRALPYADASMDVAIVQGGLHHLPELPADLARTLAEVRRVLKPGGRFVVVEPWLTPFLRVVHWTCQRPVARKAWGKLDALATMIEHERATYENWLGRPAEILAMLEREFEPEYRKAAWGKLMFVGRKRA
jgi:SAM-dependent methyltransferase